RRGKREEGSGKRGEEVRGERELQPQPHDLKWFPLIPHPSNPLFPLPASPFPHPNPLFPLPHSRFPHSIERRSSSSAASQRAPTKATRDKSVRPRANWSVNPRKEIARTSGTPSKPRTRLQLAGLARRVTTAARSSTTSPRTSPRAPRSSRIASTR